MSYIKNNFKLIAIDLDGTLIGRDLLISARNKQAIKKAIRKGVIVTLATGRTYETTAPYAKELGIKVPVICYQGAMIKNSIQTLKNDTMKLNMVKQIIKLGLDNKTQVCLYFSDRAYLSKPLTNVGQKYLNEVELLKEIRIVDLAHYYLRSEPLKAMFIDKPVRIKRFLAQAKRKFDKKLYFTISAITYLEFLSKKSSKGEALKELRKHFRIKKEETLVIGDNYNDIPLLQEGGFAVAVKNSCQELKRNADYITEAYNRDGVAKAIEKFVL